jgi:hypothetical protein
MERSVEIFLNGLLRDLELSRIDKINIEASNESRDKTITIRYRYIEGRFSIDSSRNGYSVFENNHNNVINRVNSLLGDSYYVTEITTYRNGEEFLYNEDDWENPIESNQTRNFEVLDPESGQMVTRTLNVPTANTFIDTHTDDFSLNQDNPNPPQRVPYAPPHHFDGKCYICFEDYDPLQDYCKVNCPAGHTFHCDCISEYFNHKKNRAVVGYFYRENDFNDQCPMCQHKVTTISKLPHSLAMINKFGKKNKKRKNVNNLHSELEYLLKLK